MRAEAAAAGAEHAGRVGFVDDQHAVMAARDRDQVIERRRVAIHGVEAFDGDPGLAGAALRAPALDRGVETLGIVVSR